MIRYTLVILCKWTMWCFNKLSKTQWVRGYPVGLQQGMALHACTCVRACVCLCVCVGACASKWDRETFRLSPVNFFELRWGDFHLSLKIERGDAEFGCDWGTNNNNNNSLSNSNNTSFFETVPLYVPVWCLNYDCILFDHRWSQMGSGGVRWGR